MSIRKVRQIESDIIKTLFQGSTQAAKEMGVESFTSLPGSFRVHQVPRNIAGEYVTGLTPKDEKELGKILGVDLSSRSDYWKEFLITLKEPFQDREFNMNNPKDVLEMRVALANGYIAPSLTDYRENKARYRNTVFYLYDEAEDSTRKKIYQEKSDELTSEIYKIRNQKEKLLCIGHILGISVNESYSEDLLYTKLTDYKKGLKGLESLEVALKAFEKSNQELQATYYLAKCLNRLIKIDYSNGNYEFDNIILGKTKDEVISFLTALENQVVLANLIKAYKANYVKK